MFGKTEKNKEMQNAFYVGLILQSLIYWCYYLPRAICYN